MKTILLILLAILTLSPSAFSFSEQDLGRMAEETKKINTCKSQDWHKLVFVPVDEYEELEEENEALKKENEALKDEVTYQQKRVDDIFRQARSGGADIPYPYDMRYMKPGATPYDVPSLIE